jgi:hypothetical protein
MINIIGKNQKFNSSIRRGGSVRRGGSIQYENHILFIDFLPTLIPFYKMNNAWTLDD